MKILNDNIKLFKSKLKDNIRQQIKLLKEIDEYENKRQRRIFIIILRELTFGVS